MAQESYQNKKNVSREEDLNKIQEEEREFWKEYAELMISKYRDAFLNLPHYQNELKVINEFINPQKGQKWLDLGCGSLPVTELILEKSKGEVEIIAGDLYLEPAKKRLQELGNSSIKLQHIDLSQKLPFPDNYFDGIVSSKVITYIIESQGQKGKNALKVIFQEIYRILKPGGVLIWSTPKKDVSRLTGALLASIYLLNPCQWIKQKCFLPYFAIKMIKFFTPVEEYTFLSEEEYENLLIQIGFQNSKWKISFGKQVLVNKVNKPL
ncbi:MAG TPA: methyltransferase domain-containing protein [Candidatus Pacearchaeota archaeon]|nr:methyltransferase domain-containing protein [Candidatus Pacearchaeota archaeon]HPO75163.1 methyltransferase domain-containing protein [Candidatus Pacearchaeota archaeon]